MTSAAARRRRRGVRNPAAGLVLLVAQSAGYLVVAPIVLHHLGAESLGVVTIASAVLAYASLADFGIGEALVQHVGASGGKSFKAAARDARTSYLRAVGVAGAIALPAVLLLTSVLDVGAVDRGQLRMYLLLVTAAFLGGLPSYAFTAALAGRGDTWAAKAALTVEAVVDLTAACAVLLTGHGLVALGAVAVLARACGALARWLLYRAAVEDWPVATATQRASSPEATSLTASSLLRAAWPFFVIGLATRVIFSSDALTIGIVLDAAAIARYGFAFRSFFTVLQATWHFTDFLVPRYRELVVRQAWAHLERLLRDATRLATDLVGCSVPLLVLLYNPLVRLIDDQLVVSDGLLRGFVVFALVANLVHVLNLAVLGAGRQRSAWRWAALDAAANLPLSVVGALAFGSTGVVVATGTSNALVSVSGLAWEWTRGFPQRMSLPVVVALVRVGPALAVGLAAPRGGVLLVIALVIATAVYLVDAARVVGAVLAERPGSPVLA